MPRPTTYKVFVTRPSGAGVNMPTHDDDLVLLRDRRDPGAHGPSSGSATSLSERPKQRMVGLGEDDQVERRRAAASAVRSATVARFAAGSAELSICTAAIRIGWPPQDPLKVGRSLARKASTARRWSADPPVRLIRSASKASDSASEWVAA